MSDSDLLHSPLSKFRYRTPDEDRPLEYFIAVLKLCSLWLHSWGRQYAIDQLDKHLMLTVPLRAHLARKFRIDGWWGQVFSGLVTRDPTTLTVDEKALCGVDLLVIMWEIQTTAQKELRTVAMFNPPYRTSDRCMGNVFCKGADAWKKAWWHYAGRLILHPDSPKNPHEVHEFLKGREFAYLCEACADATISRVQAQARKVKEHFEEIVSEGMRRFTSDATVIHNRSRQLMAP